MMAKTVDGEKVTKEWAKHLRKYGKKQANKKLRKIILRRLKDS
jgi:hypothetical protein